MRSRTYLDWASAAPPTAAAFRAFLKGTKHFGNPSAPHMEGREAKKVVEEARTRIARLMEVKADDVIFTSGATEANALALAGALKGSGRSLPDLHILYLPTAHSSSLRTIEGLGREGVQIEPLHITEGAVDLARLAAQLRQETYLISIDVVCGETGTRYDVRGIRRALVEAGRSDVLIHADASQLPMIESITRARLGADLITLDAQKVGGVRGAGLLVAPRYIPLQPIVEGGGQERGLRSGTEPSALIAAFAASLSECQKGHGDFSRHSTSLRARLLADIDSIEGLVINGGKAQVPHILNLSLLGRDTDYLVALLDERGYAVSTRSSCETDAEGSRVVLYMTGDAVRAASTLRVSFGPSTREGEIRRFAKALIETVAFLDSYTG
ncbi:MAG TPA: aminotransferase class V-fold PLP-dependent enzyme [Candidatus Paceibacterota bacterium]|nr:aminotransferase class V-fold PLP-dependent enzyme [Candidatus Paceibacterota bacterium]